LILNGQKHNFRNTLKTCDEQAIKEQEKGLKLILLFLANTYTGANFQNPPTQEQQGVLEASCDFVLDMFPMLSIEEIKHAFKMASAGKFEINTETYYGKFSVNLLGKILKSYVVYRKKIIASYTEEEAKELERIKKEEAKKKNVAAQLKAISDYRALKKDYQKGRFPSVSVRGHWAQLLESEGLISFTDQEKKGIWIEAKELAKVDIKKRIMERNKHEFEKTSLMKILRTVEAGQHSEEFERKAILKYSELLIQKSLLK